MTSGAQAAVMSRQRQFPVGRRRGLTELAAEGRLPDGECVVFPGDDLLARDLASSAGQLLLSLRAAAGYATVPGTQDPPGVPSPAADVRKQGDLRSQEYLAAELHRLRPGDAVLSEEAVDDSGRLSASRVWIIDPLDGTREFGEPGRSDWAVHVALWQDGGLVAGAVALPAQGRVLSTAEPVSRAPGPARAVGPSSTAEEPMRVLVSRSRPPEFVQKMASELGAELVPMGSAGAKMAAVITGQADAYVHSGGQYEWDSAAPVAVARASGLHASRIDGSALRYNQADPSVPDIVICPVERADQLLDAIASAQHDGRAR